MKYFLSFLMVSIWLIIFAIHIQNTKDSDLEKNVTFRDGILSLAEKSREGITKQVPDGRIVFTDFTDNQREKNRVSSFVAQEYLSALLAEGNVKIVDRRNSKLALDEINFQNSSLSDERSSSELGKFRGSNHILVGRTENSRRYISVSVQLLNIEENTVISSASMSMLTNNIVDELSLTQTNYNQSLTSFINRVTNFVSDNFQWLWASLLVPLFGLFYSFRKKN